MGGPAMLLEAEEDMGGRPCHSFAFTTAHHLRPPPSRPLRRRARRGNSCAEVGTEGAPGCDRVAASAISDHAREAPLEADRQTSTLCSPINRIALGRHARCPTPPTGPAP